MSDFKIGDRVVLLNYNSTFSNLKSGDTGTVCEIHGKTFYGVNWDKEIKGGHSCDGKCPKGHGWRVSSSLIKKIENPEKIIKVGDLVKIKSDNGFQSGSKNAVAIVRIVKPQGKLGIEIISVDYNGHDLGGIVENDRGWWCAANEVKLIEKETINGFTIGDRVIVRDKVGNRNVKNATGTVISFDQPCGKHDGSEICVMFDLEFNIEGHNGNYGDDDKGFGDTKSCWWIIVADKTIKKIDGDNKTEVPAEEPSREIPPQEHYTADKKEVLDVYIYVARDMDGKLFAYIEEPKIDVGGIQFYGKGFKKISDDLFAELKFEDGALKIREVKGNE